MRTPAAASITQLSRFPWRAERGPGRARRAIHLALAGGLACGIGGMAASAGAQSCPPGWALVQGPAGVPARSTTAAAPDASGNVVLFGGASGGRTYGDTWVRTLSGWERRDVPGPSARAGHLLAYDPARQRTVLFGGFGAGGALSDTWEWDGSAWTQFTPPNNPGVRAGGVLSYDGNTSGVVIAGGANALDGQAFLDTWSWNGVDWNFLGELGLTPRQSAGATYDPTRQRVVLYGGLDLVTFDQLAETVEFDGFFWNPTSFTGAPGGRENASLAFDAARQRVVLYGGIGADQRTFELDGGLWTELATAGPGPQLPLAYHAGLGKVIQLEPEPSRTFAWDGQAWSAIGPAAIPALNAHAAAWDPSSGRVAVFGGSSFLGRQLGTLWTLGPTGWELAAESGPSARDRAVLASDTLRSRLVLFGGSGGEGVLGDTWVWSGSAWSEIAGTGPAARTGSVGAYDPVRDRLVIFGGRDADFAHLADTWVFDGATWSQVAAPAGPVARDRAAMTFDTSRGRIVLFGGRDENFEQLNDFWEFDGSAWTRITTPEGPGGRSAATLSFDGAAGRLVLVGGQDADFNTINETWIYSTATGWFIAGGAELGPRSDHATAYDPVQGRLVVFGGFNGLDTVGDTWAFSAVSAAPGLRLTGQPESTLGCRGGTSSFTVSASGPGPLTYQWRFNGEPLDTTVNPSAATATLTISNVQTASAGGYDCVIGNACNTVTSRSASLSLCVLDVNCDTFVDPDDLSDYIACFFSNPACDQADFNGDTFVDPDDLSDYISLFFGDGC